MGADAKHPDYIEFADDWRLMRVSARGDGAVKDEGETYLPMPSGFRSQADSGVEMYAAYQKRARFPEIVAPTIAGMVGVIHRTEIQVEMPDSMNGLWERATPDGLPLEALARRITQELLTMGRYGLLAGAPEEGADLPWISGYGAEAIINWSPDRDFYVLDESGNVRNGFDWKEEKRYRALYLDENGKYYGELFTDSNTTQGEEYQPTGRAGKKLERIPFTIIGARDLSVNPEVPPLIGIARSAIAQYQLSADYRWQLFMSGQETFVVINGESPEQLGSSVILNLQGTEGLTAPDAKYVGPNCQGIQAHERAIEAEKQDAAAAGARLFEQEDRAQESGSARRMRYAAQTASLATISLAGSQGLESALRDVAVMIGADPEQVVVKPNLDFLDSTLGTDEILNLVKAWQAGAYSYETLYERLQKGEAVSAERSAEDELKIMDREEPMVPVPASEAGLLT